MRAYVIREASDPSDYEESRQLFEEYASRLDFDLGFQQFESELMSLPGEYTPPAGCVLLAEADGALCGCVALRPLSDDICEMKRLYVRPDQRRRGIGRALAVAAIELARKRGYATMRLDTIASMFEAMRLYESLGFREIAAYRHNPVQGARYFGLELARKDGAAMDAEVLSSILDSFDTPVLFADTEHVIQYMNRTAIQHYDKGASLIGSSLLDCHNRESQAVILEVLEALRDGEEERLITDNETHRIYMRAVRDGNGKLIGYYERYAEPRRLDPAAD